MANIRGTAGADSLTGTTSADSITGLGGNDTIRGGQGNDNLNGGADNDRYVFALGDGNDTIGKNATEHAGDIVQITSTLSENQLRLYRQDNHLVIYYGRDDSILLADHFLGEANGSAWAKLPTLSVNGFNLSLTGGLALTGTAAAETVYGTLGNDTLRGTAGNDVLQGNGGNDRYVFVQGDGQDTINGITGNNGDVIQVNGLTQDDISLIREGDALRIYYGALGDSIRLPSFFYREDISDDQKLGTLIVGSDTISLLGGLSYSGTAVADLLNGTAFADTIGGDAGADTINGRGGNDVLYGGADNDQVNGEGGDDTIYGGTGNDVLDGGAGTNVHIFETGDGQDTVYAGEGRVEDYVSIMGVDLDDVRLTGDDYTLVIHYGAGDTIRVPGHLIYDVNDRVTWLTTDDGSLNLLYGLPFTGTDASENFGGSAYGDTLSGLGGDDTLNGYEGGDVMYGGAGNDSVSGSEGDDTLDGGTGSDTLNGGRGNDTITGGTGNDFLGNAEGDDRYVFAVGDGQDTLSSGTLGNAGDVIAITGALTLADVHFSRSEYNLTIHYGASGDSIYVPSFFYRQSDTYGDLRVGSLTVGGVTLDLLGAFAMSATDAGDTFTGFIHNDTIWAAGGDDSVGGGSGDDSVDGGTGNDTLSGYDGLDKLDGGAGNDNLNGEAGNDTITGGTGNDFLGNAEGDDRYVFAVGDGQDTLSSGTLGNAGDVIAITGALTLADVSFSRSEHNLTIHYGTAGDSIYVPSFFYRQSDTYGDLRVGSLTVGGATLDLMGAFAMSGTEAGDTFTGFIYNDTIWSGGGDDSLDGGAGNDTLSGYDGQDTLRGGAGNDTLEGGLGGDRLYGGTGNDSLFGGGAGNRYYFAPGDGQDTINPDGYYGDAVEIAGVGAAGIRLMSDGNQLIIHYGTSGDTIRVWNQLNPYTSDNKLGTLYFDGGSIGLSYGLPLTGTEASESFGGTRYNDTLKGLGGNDNLDGEEGADVLDGGAGNDTLEGYDGDDTLLGGDGNDTLSGIAGDDSLEGGAGDDSLAGHEGWDKLYGGAGNDTIDGGLGGDWIIGGTGNDSLYGNGAGNSYYFAPGDGNDTINPDGYYGDSVRITGVSAAGIRFMSDSNQLIIHYGTSGDTIRIWNQLNSYSTDNKIGTLYYEGGSIGLGYGLPFTGTEASESFGGTRYNDTLKGLGGNDTLDGEEGNDVLDGGAGADSLLGYAGDDSMLGGERWDTLHGMEGNDTLNGGLDNDQMYGWAGDDLYYVDNTGDRTYENADSGIDTVISTISWALSAEVEHLTLAGTAAVGTGNGLANRITGNEGANTLIGGASADTLDGGAGADSLDGGIGNDSLLGGARWDTLSGGDGNDTLDGGLDNDQMYGGLGDDVYYVDNSGDRVNENAGTNEGFDRVFSTVTWNMSANIETVEFTGTAATSSTGNSLHNTMTGNAGNNTLIGGSGHDTINGFDGNDSLDGGTESDVLDGGTGNDTILGGQRWDTLTGGAGDDVLDGGTENDRMVGNAGNDTYYMDHVGDRVVEAAGEGTDLVWSSIDWAMAAEVENLILTGSAVTATGNGLNNRITGNANANVLNGGNGNDTLTGGAGADTLTGGTGRDDFVFNAAASNGTDRITDFATTIDRLVFKSSDYGFAAGHVLTAAQFTSGASAVGTGAQFIWDAATKHLYWDADGTGSGVRIDLSLLDGATVTKDDLVFTA